MNMQSRNKTNSTLETPIAFLPYKARPSSGSRVWLHNMSDISQPYSDMETVSYICLYSNVSI